MSAILLCLCSCCLMIVTYSNSMMADIHPGLKNLADELMTKISDKCSLTHTSLPGDTGQAMDMWTETDRLLKASRTLNVTCTVSADDTPWNWTEFQEVTNKLSRTHTGVFLGVTVMCSPGGSVVMKRPHQATLVRSLAVYGCTIHSYRVLDTNVVLDKPNDLEIFVLQSCILHKRLSESLEEIQRNHAPDCLINPVLKYYKQYNLTDFHDWDIDRKLTENDIIPLKQQQEQNCLCPVLEYLELSGQTIFQEEYSSYINGSHISVCVPTPRLKVLVLRGNRMISVPYNLFAGKWWKQFGSLEEIDLSYNQITSLPFRSRQPLSANPAVLFNLSYNSIKSITPDEMKGLSEFWPNYVSLDNNPLLCSSTCNGSDVISFLKKATHPGNPGGKNKIYEEIGANIVCMHPTSDNATGETLLNVTRHVCGHTESDRSISGDNSSTSMDTYHYIAGICGVLTGQTLVVCIIIWYRRKSKMAVKVSYKSPGPPGSVDFKVYDAFISYSSLDETWVLDPLYTYLVSNNFHVCLHHKDFVPGVCIAENIINSIDQSKHTILVLTPNFLKSEWCLLEFRKAFQQSLTEHTGHLIVVVKESVDLVSVEADMRHFIQTYTYLSLSDHCFWDKLKRTLT